MIDVNVHLSRWPCRRLPLDETATLLKKLADEQVSQAWAGSFDALLHRDMAAVNARLAGACRTSNGRLIPIGSVNPRLPDWKEDLRRCHEVHHMPGIRLFPNYHGYDLESPEFAELLELAERRELIVQLAFKMEDEMTQHPLMRVAKVDTSPLPRLLANRRKQRLVILNGLKDLKAAEVEELASSGNVYFEIAMLEGVGGINRLLATVPLERILFGSHAPFFNFESAKFKLRESELAQFQREAITSGNARALLKRQE